MKFGVLGPLEVFDDAARPTPLNSAKQRALLGILLARRNNTVTTDQLITGLWRGRVPTSARTSVQVYIHRMRRTLGAERIVHDVHGYRLVVNTGEVDDENFERLAEAGRAALEGGDAMLAAESLNEALSLWRGPRSFAETCDSEPVHLEAARLDELRELALERRVDAELQLGRHAQLIPELSILVMTNPWRERLHGQLMLALHRAGRTAEALEVYRRARRTLIDEFGFEPGHELRHLEHAIISADPHLAAPTRTSTVRIAEGQPVELPAPDPAFTGRHEEISRATSWLIGSDGTAAARSVVLSGPGAVGKSAVAVQVAHAIEAHFPDGAHYVNLGGAAARHTPMTAHAALVILLRSLGTADDRIPPEIGAAASLFRSILARRRALIILDDAANAAHVRPLLPGASSESATIVTSRSMLATISHLARIRLGSLSPDESMVMLARCLGTDRVAAEPDVAADIVRLCGYLPLAIRIVGARWVTHPERSLASLRDRLADRRGRLDELHIGRLSVRASFDASYRTLPPDAADLFQHLGLVGATDFSPEVAADLVGRPVDQVRRDLDHLVDAWLLTATAEEQLSLHELPSLYAFERSLIALDASTRAEAAARFRRQHLTTAQN